MAKINLIIADDQRDIDLYFKIRSNYHFVLDYNKYDLSYAYYSSRKHMYDNVQFIEEL